MFARARTSAAKARTLDLVMGDHARVERSEAGAIRCYCRFGRTAIRNDFGRERSETNSEHDKAHRVESSQDAGGDGRCIHIGGGLYSRAD